jgi:hypothetical protein
MSMRRVVVAGAVVAGVLWFQVAGWFEAGRIQAQRESRVATQARAASLRVDSERLMQTVTALADPKLEGRAAGSPGGMAARAMVVERFESIGLEPVSGGFVHPFMFSNRAGTEREKGANVLGMCLGRDPKLPWFVMSAHYDHLGVREGMVYPGANDNASGVAVLLEVAAYCRKQPFRRTIVFAAFDAEEVGLQGARAFLSSPSAPKDRIALNVNLDMVSRSTTREIFAAGTYHTPALRPPLEEVAKRAPITLLFGHDKPKALAGGVDDWTNQSDHGPFHAANIPFVYFGVEDHPDYHKPTDTADRIDRGFFVDVAETILDALLALDLAR